MNIFKPLKKKYHFDDTLWMNVPKYMIRPLGNWIIQVFREWHFVDPLSMPSKIDPDFLSKLDVRFRETFPDRLDQFLDYLFSDSDRTITFLQYLLYCRPDEYQAIKLESMLSDGGSGYMVKITETEDGTGIKKISCNMLERVPGVVMDAVENTLKSSASINKAWIACYKKDPDYIKVVIESQNALEGIMKNKYAPKDQSPQLGKLIANMKSSQSPLDVKGGGSLLKDTKLLLNLIEKVPSYRGMHIEGGSGKRPSREQAEYVLYTTIYFWTLHNK